MAQTSEAVEEKDQQTQDQPGDNQQDESKTQAQAAEFSEASSPEAPGAGSSIDILLDMNIPVTVSIGQTDMPVKQLLQIGPGSVLKLDKSINAPADLFMNNIKFATGTVVVVEGRFGVRIDNILGLHESAGQPKK